jgi:hypothetical protein
MPITTEIGRRIELVSMDPHFHDISIGLYRQERETGPEYLVHTYSQKPGASQRIEFVTQAMAKLGGMQQLGPRLRFTCGDPHQLTVRRIFIEACKLKPDAEVAPRPLCILDKKSNLNITVSSVGSGSYEIRAEAGGDEGGSRVAAIAGGLAKLAEMVRGDSTPERVAFACKHAHDDAVGTMLIRALNVRAILREEEMAASRGVLAAPSAQK